MTNSINHQNHSQQQRRRLRRRRIRTIEREAASRTLNGNGSSPSLPPLPITKHHTEEEHDNDDGSLSTLFSHPYGALPYGNIYTAASSTSTTTTSNSSSSQQPQHPDHVRRNGLGTHLSRLNDEQLLMVLSYLDGTTLGRIVGCSRYLYVAGHHTDLWRDLVLAEQPPMGGIVWYGDTWKDTYVHQRLSSSSSSSSSPSSSSSSNDKTLSPHKPIQIQGIYSDTLFRSWLCRSFSLDPRTFLSTETVPIENHKDLTTQRFLSKYEETNTPVVIKGATLSWPALHKWSSNTKNTNSSPQTYLETTTHPTTFRATSGTAPLPAQFTFSQYQNYCQSLSRSSVDEGPLYLFDREFRKTCPVLVDDFRKGLYETCPWFCPSADHGHDLLGLLGEEGRPDYCWIIAGPKRSGSSFHIDPNGTHAWNAPIIGRKRWIFYPPGHPPPGVVPSRSGDDVAMPVSLGEWFLTYWDEHVRRREEGKEEEKEGRPLECTVEPGDILFVPHGWWHCVVNLDDGMSVGLTQNYVSRSNLGNVLRFLERKQSQISGCRDRVVATADTGQGNGIGVGTMGAIPPEKLKEVFEKKLREVRPDLLAWGREKAKEGWTCKAWNDDDEDDGNTGSEIVDENKEKYDNGNAGESDGACGRRETKRRKTGGGRSVLDRAKSGMDGVCGFGGDKTSLAKQSNPVGFAFSFM